MVQQGRRDGGIATRGHICGITRAAEVPEASGSHDAPGRDQKRTGEGTQAELVDRGPELEAGEIAGRVYQASARRIGRVPLGWEGIDGGEPLAGVIHLTSCYQSAGHLGGLGGALRGWCGRAMRSMKSRGKKRKSRRRLRRTRGNTPASNS
ncbi:uncharacterized protein LY79DRAFT_108094 [Colletotrichum navitas]|uniref:Uncharacterized protein n=1 Tax=Colletotrichum navitas TaxID=681940 RepID=A0AAD8Q5M6_9PEZI|nr:uncharacterized protein LY79DRAFT_108094 [Colletotrichum navitas]KAK1595259.1 hypothetical protein LY79DRAFT_108094 [Colletotrichum navitas]